MISKVIPLQATVIAVVKISRPAMGGRNCTLGWSDLDKPFSSNCILKHSEYGTRNQKGLFTFAMNKYVYNWAYFRLLLILCIVLFPVGLAWGTWGRNEGSVSTTFSHFTVMYWLLHLKVTKGDLVWDTHMNDFIHL